MLVIRKAQMEVFAENARQNFEDRLTARLCKKSERKLQETDNEAVRQLMRTAMADGVRELVRSGMVRAPDYGLTTEYEVASFVELTYDVAPDFDTSPKTPWAAQILNDDGIAGPEKIKQLQAAANEALQNKHGPS